jgi:hypothetical protein
MSRVFQRRLFQLTPVLLAIWCGGCSGGNTGGAAVSGSVTLDGAPIEDGTISFQPDGEGAPAGGKITKGQYSVKGVSTGRNRVHVEVPGPKRTAAEARAERGKAPATSVQNPTVGAQGNDQTVDIEPGEQKKDIQLQKGGS